MVVRPQSWLSQLDSITRSQWNYLSHQHHAKHTLNSRTHLGGRSSSFSRRRGHSICSSGGLVAHQDPLESKAPLGHCAFVSLLSPCHYFPAMSSNLTNGFDLGLVSDDSQEWDGKDRWDEDDDSTAGADSDHEDVSTAESQRATISPDRAQLPKRPSYPPLVGRKGEYENVQKPTAEARQDFHEETMGFYIGTMPEEEWLDTAYPLRVGEVEAEPPPTDFSRVLAAKTELDMYEPLVEGILKSGYMPQNIEIIISANTSSETSNLRPDINVLRLPRHIKGRQSREPGRILKDAFDFRESACGIELKLKEEYDGFNDDPTADSCENTGGDGASTRGQLAMYAEEIFHQQHVTSVPQILICKRWARFLKWDRSAALVSRRFDYTENPQLLLRTLRRILTRSSAGRGLDPTVRRAVPKETEKFQDAVVAYIKARRSGDGTKQLQAAYVALDSAHRCHVVHVPDKGLPLGFREVIVGRPFWTSHSPIGRGTRGYVAYDITAERLVFMKDSWRVDHPDCLPEMEAYHAMRAADPPVSNVLYPMCGGDVGSWPGGSIQRTQNQYWADDTSAWRAPCQKLRPLIHTRIVQELAYPVISVDNSRQALKVFKDVLTGLDQAHKAGILHQDVAVHHIVWLPGAIPGLPKGFLIDWDHSRRVGPEESQHDDPVSAEAITQDGDTSGLPTGPATSDMHIAPLAFRSASWPSLSIELLLDPFKKPVFFHDVESVFWCLCYFASSFCDQDAETNSLKIKSMSIFEAPAERTYLDLNSRTAISAPKFGALENEMVVKLAYKSQPLGRVLGTLNSMYCSYYLAQKVENMVPPNHPFAQQAVATRKASRRELTTTAFMRQILDGALQEDGWLTGDVVDNQIQELSAAARRRLLERQERLQYDSSHRTHTGGTDTNLMQQAGCLHMGTVAGDKRKFATDNTNGEPNKGRPSKAPRTTFRSVR